MNRLLIHYVEGEDICTVLEKVKIAIQSGICVAKNSEFNFTLDTFTVDTTQKVSARCLELLNVPTLNSTP